MVFREIIENLQERRLKKSARSASPEQRRKISQQIFIIEQNKERRRLIDKAEAQARFDARLQAAKDRPAFDAEQRRATQSFKVRNLRSKGSLPVSKKPEGKFSKFLAGTGVAQGTAPIIRNGGGNQRMDILGGGSGPSNFSVVGGFQQPVAQPVTKKRRKSSKRRRK